MRNKKFWIAVTALCLIAGMIFGMIACGRRNETPETANPDTQPNGSAETGSAATEYTIELLSEGGMPLEGVGIYVYADDTLADLVWFAKTDAAGKITFNANTGDGAVAVLENVPDGYQVDASYPLTGVATQILLSSAMMSADDLTGVTFELGEMMYDLSVTTADGTVYQLSELLKEKTAVVLNFWYLECNPCKTEFPYLQEAYEKYSDQIEVLAMNPVNDDAEAIEAYRQENGLTFPMAPCSPAWAEAMQLTAYPTTVVIDRYGTISMIHKGSIPDAEIFETIFEYYVAEDYQQGLSSDLDTILQEAEEKAYEMSIGTSDNPDEFSGVTSRKITVPAGEKYYCNVYKVSKLYLTISDPDAYVIYNGKTYKPSGGTVSLTITSEDVSTACQLVIGNSGDELKEFTMRFGLPSGTQSNPLSLKLGTFTVKVSAGNSQGVYYKYKCKESGTIVAKCLSATSGVDYDLTLYNLDTYALRNMQGENQVDADGNPVVTIKVNKGDELLFSAGSLPDSSGYYPGVNLKVDVNYTTDDSLIIEDEEKVETKVYSVTITDESRKGVSGVQVYLANETETKQLTTSADGVAAAELVPGTYNAVLKLPAGYGARTTEFVLTEAIPNVSIKVDEVEASDRAYKDLTNIGIAYYVELGENQVELTYSTLAEVYNYFIFVPAETGLYQISSPDEHVALSYWATTVYPYNASSEIENNTFEINVKNLIEGQGYVIGVVGEDSCNLVIERIADAVLDESDAEWSETWQKGLTAPPTKQFKLSSGGSKLTYVNLESNAKAVYNESDGYYHLNTKNGPIIYVNLGPNAQYISLYDMLGFNGDGGGAQNLTRYFYEEDGTFIRREKYTDWMRQYIEMRDTSYDVYPLTDTLIYMIQNGGEQFGWWDENSAVYKFADIDLNVDIAWMFACCYIPN